MSEKIKNKRSDNYPVSFLLSLLFHLMLFIVAAFYISLQIQNPIINSVYLDFQKKDFSQRNDLEEVIKNEEKMDPEKEIANEPADAFYNFSKTEYDTSEVKQIYKESTLNVSLRYPNGWTYIDQNVKEKLDGVTFWSTQGNYEIPPYIFLEVQDKYIFNPSRYKYKLEQKGNIYYYNDPEEMEGYYTQIIYIRTESDEDYSLKLMVKGKETFNSFQPVFFSMAKSFSFGKSFL
jgi:hypothetical protein